MLFVYVIYTYIYIHIRVRIHHVQGCSKGGLVYPPTLRNKLKLTIYTIYISTHLDTI